MLITTRDGQKKPDPKRPGPVSGDRPGLPPNLRRSSSPLDALASGGWIDEGYSPFVCHDISVGSWVCVSLEEFLTCVLSASSSVITLSYSEGLFWVCWRLRDVSRSRMKAGKQSSSAPLVFGAKILASWFSTHSPFSTSSWHTAFLLFRGQSVELDPAYSHPVVSDPNFSLFHPLRGLCDQP